MSADRPLASPLSLLEGAEEAEEVLLLSFSLNLAFWERFALGRARALGALATLVADPAVVEADPAAVKRAGISYVPGLAMCRNRGAFHPKLIVVASEQHADIALGSGNTTLAGWHANAELWTVLRADEQGAPDTVAHVADWLAALSDHVDFTPGVTDALERVAGRLRGFSPSEPGPTLVHNLGAPIIDALPRGPVEDLVVCAPFFDRDGAAIQALIERLVPSRLRVLVQPGQTVIDGARVAAVVERYRGEIEPLVEERYHHGKLIQWRKDGRWTALTGSANASRQALITKMEDGGNCELGLIADIQSSLAPETGRSFSGEDAARLLWRPRSESRADLLLLAAVLEPEGVRLTLGRKLGAPATLQVADGDIWSPTVEVSAQERDIVLPFAPPAGAPVRLSDAEGRISNTVFVIGPQALRRQTRHQGRVLVDENTIFEDFADAEAFVKDLLELRRWLPANASTPRPNGGPHSDDGSERKVERETWAQYLERCTSSVGERMLHFALPLPELSPADSRDAESDDVEEEGEDSGRQPPARSRASHDDFASLSTYRRRRWQRWCSQLVELSPQLVPIGRILALRLLIGRVAAGLWSQPEEWVPLLARATSALNQPPGPQPEELPAAAGLAAVGLALVRGQVQRFGGYDPLRAPYESTLAAVRELLPHATEPLVSAYAADLAHSPALALPASEILHVARIAHDADPIDVAIVTLRDEYDLASRRDGRLIEITATVDAAATQFIALRVLGLAQDAAPVATVARSQDRTVIGIWTPPNLIFLIRNQHLTRGIAHRLPSGVGPHHYASKPHELPPALIHWSAGSPPPVFDAAIRAVEIDIDKTLHVHNARAEDD